MEQILRNRDGDVQAPKLSEPDVPPSASLRRLAPFALFALACFLVAPYLGLSSRTIDPRIAEVWPPGGVGFVLLTTVWSAGRRLVAGTLAVMLVAFVVTALAQDYSLPGAGWIALVGVAQPLLMAVLYRWYLPHPGWAPENPRDVAALLVAAVSTSVLLGLVGGYPLLSPDDLPSQVLLWWVLRNTVYCFVGGAMFLVLFYARRSSVVSPSPWLNRVGLLACCAICVSGAYYDPSLPLSWLLIVPAVWGGLTLTVRGAGWLVLTISMFAVAMTYVPQNQFGYGGALPASSIIDLLVIASTGFAMLLALMREQRNALIDQLDRNGAESESQRQILATVFESMMDGVVIVDHSRVTMHNSAARQLLGRPIPVGEPVSWAQSFGLRDAKGNVLDDEALRAGLTVDGATTASRTLEVHVGPEEGGRVIDISAQPLPTAGARSTIVLLHDVTAQRARLRELTNFAGMVAHDLRGPLTVLDGWLEVVQDGEADSQIVLDDAVAKARDASRRMRRVIDDWLNYTVVQNGRLSPEPTKLHEVATEIVDSRRASWADGDEPRFLLDLTHSVDADPGLMRQLLDNLVGNAIKYTAADQAPWVHLVSTEDTEPGWVRVDVIDHGIGVPEGQEQLIFEEFHRGPVEGRSAGTGLGLALTRRIVTLHGGRLSARRNPEGGSTFSFTLPEA